MTSNITPNDVAEFRTYVDTVVFADLPDSATTFLIKYRILNKLTELEDRISSVRPMPQTDTDGRAVDNP